MRNDPCRDCMIRTAGCQTVCLKKAEAERLAAIDDADRKQRIRLGEDLRALRLRHISASRAKNDRRRRRRR